MRRSVIWLLGCSLAAGAPTMAADLDWHLYPPGCQGGAATVEILCGSVGRYLVDLQATPSCQETRHGAQSESVLHTYPPPQGTTFPTRARRLEEILPPLVSGNTTKKKGAIVSAIPAPGPSLRWMGIADFGNEHGDSTTALAGQVAGPDVSAVLVTLDRPALAPLGDVGDFHVLAALCSIAEAVRTGGVPRPEVVNMSFGRRAHSEDPHSAAECALPGVPQTAACEIARVVAQLTQQGTRFVSAAGNHGAPLFPGTLDDVISAGMLEPTSFFDGGSLEPAWETPADADALIPGNALCLGTSAAPAGSSYSSAMLAGWIVRVLKSSSVQANLNAGTWAPIQQNGCWKLGRVLLTQNPPQWKVSPWCNQAITDIFNDLSGSSAACWNAASEPTVTAPVQAPTTPMEDIDPLDAHVFLATHPTPESDPCVPCSGRMVATSLRIDLSRSEPLPESIVLDEVSLRVGESFLKLELTEEDLNAMTAGELAAILVPDMTSWLTTNDSMSLWYRMKVGDGSCDLGGDCFWSSTPLLIDK